MAIPMNGDSMLGPFRVLDLTDEKGWFCGKLLGDLGADVIKVEAPGGDPGRKTGPFPDDTVNPEKSLYWIAFNTSKRGVTLDLEKAEGREILRRLAKTADVILESFPAGYMESLQLGYPYLERTNPRLVMVSISPFGQSGAYRDLKTSGIVSWAMGGYMYAYGDEDRPPIQISHHPHAYLHAASEAAGATLLALYCREVTGQGQHVDVSVHEAVARLDMTLKWDMTGVFLRRGLGLGARKSKSRLIWRCRDGYIVWNFWVGAGARLWTHPFIEWMASEIEIDSDLRQVDWETIGAPKAGGVEGLEKVLARIEEPASRFFMGHGKTELAEEAKRRGLMLYPVADAQDVLESRQLTARNFWQKCNTASLKASVLYPGPLAKTSEPGVIRGVSAPAPMIGEHNQEVYAGELGISSQELEHLKNSGII